MQLGRGCDSSIKPSNAVISQFKFALLFNFLLQERVSASFVLVTTYTPSIQMTEPTSPSSGGKSSLERGQDDEQSHFTIANCRMYEGKYPEVDDLVIAEVKSIEEMGAYVSLKEYNDIEGMILLSELSRRRIRSINKIIRVGRLEVVVVLRVDREKGKEPNGKERKE